jgi:hypothetical protein
VLELKRKERELKNLVGITNKVREQSKLWK